MVSYQVFVVSHTHWDREWYQPFQEYRLRLAQLVTKLLALMRDEPRYRHFMLDGQTIVLEDFLEIYPERETEIMRLIHDGRLLIGPWYVLPDEFLVSPESIIRNLMLGDRIANRFGGKMLIGYVPDPFGHISQLPQILVGFGIDTACFWRGIEYERTEVLWEAPDGTTVMVCNLRDSYGHAAWLPKDPEAFIRVVQNAVQSLIPYLTTNYVLLMNGMDHMEPMPELPDLIEAMNKRAHDLNLVHGTLPQYVAAVRAVRPSLDRVRGEMRSSRRTYLLPGVLSSRIWIKQRNWACETLLEKWAEPHVAWALSLNGQRDIGFAPLPALRQAWRYLIQNHPHDSICGCSIDPVHEEMKTRFTWVEQMGEDLTHRALRAITRRVNTEPPWTSVVNSDGDYLLPPPTSIPLLVFNPLNGPRTEFVTAQVAIPPSMVSFRLIDEEGEEIPYTVIRRKEGSVARHSINRVKLLRMFSEEEEKQGQVKRQDILSLRYGEEQGVGKIQIVRGDHGGMDLELLQRTMKRLLEVSKGVDEYRVETHNCPIVEIGFVATGLPAFGYRTYYLVTAPEAKRGGRSGELTCIENEFFRVWADPSDGTLTVQDLRTGVTYPGLNRFVDGGDRGDEYNFCQPEEDRLITVPISPPTIQVLADEAGREILSIKMRYRVPQSLRAGRRGRTKRMVDMPITSRVQLVPGVPRIDIETTVTNHARDHRLRVHFPVPIGADVSWAEGHFDVLSRPVDLPPDAPDAYAEPPVSTHPQRTFVDINDGKIGLLLANRGLPEYEVLRGEDREQSEVALTLLRCVGWLSRDDLHSRPGNAGPMLPAPNAQMPGTFRFHYSLVPHAGDWSAVYQQAHAFNALPRVFVSSVHEGELSPIHSFLRVEPRDFVISAIKWAEDGSGIIVRGYNISESPIRAQIYLYRSFKRAVLTNLNEEEIADITPADGSSVILDLPGRRIATVKFQI